MPLFGPSTFETAREQKLSQRQKALDKAAEVLFQYPFHPKEDALLLSPAYEIAEKIKAKLWTSEEVVVAFARRCLETHHDLNTLTEVMLAEAIEQAKAHDEYQSRTGNVLGPLHGVPFTLKDTYNVEGYDSSLGISTFVNQPATRSSVLHSTLTRLGGILLAKTNVPQTLLAFECSNPIFGATHNPYVKGFSCGGSSGGEAAVLARNASAIGFGGDIGGSLRIPSGWCGIYALKPTKGRFTTRGHFGLAAGFEAVPPVTGPMGRSVEDLVFISKTLMNEELSKFDSSVLPIPWRDSQFAKYSSKKLKFGYYFDDGVTISSPPVKRAILQTAEALKSQGHEVIPVLPPNALEAVRIFVGLTACEGYANLRSPIKNDPMESTVKLILTVGGLPKWLRSCLALVVEYVLGDPKGAEIMRLAGQNTATQFKSWTLRRDLFRQEFNDWFQQQELDAIIAPTSIIPAPKLYGTTLVSPIAATTFLYNVLDLPVGVVPVTKVKKGEGMEESRWKGREKEGYSKVILDRLYGNGTVYKDIMEGGLGLPIGVQVVGGVSSGEEGVLAIMGQVAGALAKSGAEMY